MGKIAEAENCLLQSQTITKEIGFVRDIINILYEFARLRVAQNNPEQASELLALVLQHPASHQARLREGQRELNRSWELLSKTSLQNSA
jgi:hypothetical protein